jgi:hypothetical protein
MGLGGGHAAAGDNKHSLKGQEGRRAGVLCAKIHKNYKVKAHHECGKHQHLGFNSLVPTSRLVPPPAPMVGCDWNFWQEQGSNPMMRSGRGMALHLAIFLVLLLPGTGTGSAPSTSGGDGKEALPGILHQLLHVGTQAYNRGDYTFASSCFRTVARAERGELLVHCLVAPSHRYISQRMRWKSFRNIKAPVPSKLMPILS